jgi:hypothetical protein
MSGEGEEHLIEAGLAEREVGDGNARIRKGNERCGGTVGV